MIIALKFECVFKLFAIIFFLLKQLVETRLYIAKWEDVKDSFDHF